MVAGTANGSVFAVPLEPDGTGGHWFELDEELKQVLNVTEGMVIDVELEAIKEWPEPPVADDIVRALAQNQSAKALWDKVTPLARWDWVRWINSTGNAQTRQKRIEVACSKLRAGTRRPCCFNRSMSCVPQVSKNGVLQAS